jgi:hypothetical protein
MLLLAIVVELNLSCFRAFQELIVVNYSTCTTNVSLIAHMWILKLFDFLNQPCDSIVFVHACGSYLLSKLNSLITIACEILISIGLQIANGKMCCYTHKSKILSLLVPIRKLIYNLTILKNI